MYTNSEAITLQANGLKSKAGDIYALVEEILLQPRWDETEFSRIRDETLESINRRRVNPGAVASEVYGRLVYGPDHILGYPTIGSAGSVSAITTDDLKAYYAANFSPSVSFIAVAGDITQDEAVELFRPLEEKWQAKDVQFGG